MERADRFASPKRNFAVVFCGAGAQNLGDRVAPFPPHGYAFQEPSAAGRDRMHGHGQDEAWREVGQGARRRSRVS